MTEECMICFHGMNASNTFSNPVVTLSCKHRFHEFCIATWAGNCKIFSCPYCGQEETTYFALGCFYVGKNPFPTWILCRKETPWSMLVHRCAAMSFCAPHKLWIFKRFPQNEAARIIANNQCLVGHCLQHMDRIIIVKEGWTPEDSKTCNNMIAQL